MVLQECLNLFADKLRLFELHVVAGTGDFDVDRIGNTVSESSAEFGGIILSFSALITNAGTSISANLSRTSNRLQATKSPYTMAGGTVSSRSRERCTTLPVPCCVPSRIGQ